MKEVLFMLSIPITPRLKYVLEDAINRANTDGTKLLSTFHIEQALKRYQQEDIPCVDSSNTSPESPSETG